MQSAIIPRLTAVRPCANLIFNLVRPRFSFLGAALLWTWLFAALQAVPKRKIFIENIILKVEARITFIECCRVDKFKI